MKNSCQIGYIMEEREGGGSESEEDEKHSGADLDAGSGEAWLVNLAKAASKNYQRKKEKTVTSLGNKSISDLGTSDRRGDVEPEQKKQASTSDVVEDTTPKEVESEENSVVKFEVGAKVRRSLRDPFELRRQVLEDLKRLPEVEVCKRQVKILLIFANLFAFQVGSLPHVYPEMGSGSGGTKNPFTKTGSQPAVSKASVGNLQEEGAGCSLQGAWGGQADCVQVGKLILIDESRD